MGKDLWGGVAMHLEVEEIDFFPMWGRIAVHLRGRNLNSFPLWEGFVVKDSCASSSCNERFEGRWLCI